MNRRRAPLFSIWFGVVVFLGAFLLFQVQPIIGKRILPWFGAVPAVWTTSMLFFQVLLLAGYAYAHALVRFSSLRAALGLHVALLTVSVFLLPITPSEAWKPEGSAMPTLRILGLLTAHVGLPFFLLSSTGPLVQSWLVILFGSRSPYRLYALSNVASLGALVSYPLVFEPLVGTSRQCGLWSWAFAVFAWSYGGLAVAVWVGSPSRERDSTSSERTPKQVTARAAGDDDRRAWPIWLLLPALASMTMLSVTNHLSQDVAVVPLFWVVPLALYLLTFIVCFESDRWYDRLRISIAAFASVMLVCAVLRASYLDLLFQAWNLPVNPSRLAASLPVEATCLLVMLLLVAMVCHGEAVRTRPSPRHLTFFYLMVAAGGALGGAVVSVVCPLVFSSYLELNVSMTLGFLLSAFVIRDQGKRQGLWKRPVPKYLAAAFCALGILVLAVTNLDTVESNGLESRRNFYGVLQVDLLDRGGSDERLLLRNGRIVHGYQWTDPLRGSEPTSYYSEQSGVGLLLRNSREGPLRVGVLGLGVGTVAAYGDADDYYGFYEINPEVIRIAEQRFTFLRHSRAETEVRLGDARLVMEDQSPQQYDVLILDAFNGDAVPVHLLTVEAFGAYLRHVKPEGVIAAHLSNRHLDLVSVVRRVGAEHGLKSVRIAGESADHASDWLLLARRAELLSADWLQPHVDDSIPVGKSVPLWTDDHSNLLGALK